MPRAPGRDVAEDGSPRGASANGATATRRRVIDAAVACILELGFYRASSNEIARRAGVTWGVIQHYFGTREALMEAVLEDGAQRFAESVESVHIEADSVPERVNQLIDALASHYAQPAYLAHLQVLLSMDHDPRTSAEVRATLRHTAQRMHDHIRRLLREALGPAARVNELASTIFVILRGFGISQQLLEHMAYDAPAPKRDRAARQRRLLAEILSSYLEGVAVS